MRIAPTELTEKEAEAFAVLNGYAKDPDRVFPRTVSARMLARHYAKRAAERDGVVNPTNVDLVGRFSPRRFFRVAGVMLARLRKKGYLVIVDHRGPEKTPVYCVADVEEVGS